jgi:hypothetical protein
MFVSHGRVSGWYIRMLDLPLTSTSPVFVCPLRSPGLDGIPCTACMRWRFFSRHEVFLFILILMSHVFAAKAATPLPEQCCRAATYTHPYCISFIENHVEHEPIGV